jgi:hypothetical protein
MAFNLLFYIFPLLLQKRGRLQPNFCFLMDIGILQPGKDISIRDHLTAIPDLVRKQISTVPLKGGHLNLNSNQIQILKFRKFQIQIQIKS